jgi:hypothetical protein
MLIKMTLSKMTLSKMTLSKMTFRITKNATLSITILNIVRRIAAMLLC